MPRWIGYRDTRTVKFEARVLGMSAEPVPVPFSLVWKICSQRRAMLYASP